MPASAATLCYTAVPSTTLACVSGRRQITKHMALHQLTLAVLPDVMAICRLEAGSAIPGWATSGPFFSITRTDDELSVACLQALVPAEVRCDRDWRCLRVAG